MDLMHVGYSAKRHGKMQVPIDLWRKVPIGALDRAMSDIDRNAFREALVWHMARTGVNIPDLAAATGVTGDVIKKLRSKSRSNNQTSVGNAIPIANYFGFSVERFLRKEAPDAESRLKELADIMLPDEEVAVEALMMRLLQSRGMK